MRRFAVACLIAIACTAAQAQRRPLDPADQAEIERVQALGAALYEAYRAALRGQPENSAQNAGATALAEAIELAEAAVTDACDVPYQTVVLVHGPKKLTVYRIGIPPAERGIMIGRHYRIDIDVAERRVEQLSRSSKTCFFVPPPQGMPDGTTPRGIALTHGGSPQPNEYHVLLSLLHPQIFYVATHRALWTVESGRIAFMLYRSTQPGDLSR
jgi:hypothetical protein